MNAKLANEVQGVNFINRVSKAETFNDKGKRVTSHWKTWQTPP